MDGLELKLRRVKARLTQWELGVRSGVNPARISEMENDHRPVADSVVKVLDELLQPVGVEELGA